MKLVSDLQEWLMNAAERFGDPSIPVGQIFARFAYKDARESEDIVVVWDGRELRIGVGEGDWLPIPVDVDGPVISEAGELECFGIREVCSGLWQITPSLNVPGVIHAFVIIYDAPIVPPWKSLIITPAMDAAQRFRQQIGRIIG
jgi:hypothetical protein